MSECLTPRVAVACCWQGGGIYRHVWLTKRSPVHLTTWGTHVIPQVLPGTIIEADYAEAQGQGSLQAAGFLNISAVVASDAAAASYGLSSAAPSSIASLVTATFDLIDADDTVVTSLTTAVAVPVAEGGEATVEANGAVSKAVDLWTGEQLTHDLSQ